MISPRFDILGQVLRGYARRVDEAISIGDRVQAEKWLGILEYNAGPPERDEIARLRARLAALPALETASPGTRCGSDE